MSAAGPYTSVPSPAVDAALDGALARIAGELDRRRPEGLAGAVLGGGYGRGEGGVRHTPEGDRLYNDLDFFVFTDHADRKQRGRIADELRAIAGPLEKELGIAVDFSPPKELRSLANVSRTLMFQELRNGWKPVWGTVDLSRWIPALGPAEIPYTEAVRLLMNRGMGLLFAGERLAAGDGDADFIVRNMNKAALGCGDALLLAAGQYRWRGADRVAAFAEYAEKNGLPAEYAEAYAEAFRYKLEPDPVLPEDPRRCWADRRRFFLDAVRLAAGADAGAEIADAARGLRRKAADARSVRHFLRWLVRARGLRPFGRLTEDPVVTVLDMICGVLAAGEICPACPPKLHGLWCKFN